MVLCSKTSSRLKSGARFEVGGGGEVLSINQSVELCYFNSKTLIIYFIILIVKFYFNSKFA